jgi:hypothetical protein
MLPTAPRLTYSLAVSLDRYVEDESGNFDLPAPHVVGQPGDRGGGKPFFPSPPERLNRRLAENPPARAGVLYLRCERAA